MDLATTSTTTSYYENGEYYSYSSSSGEADGGHSFPRPPARKKPPPRPELHLDLSFLEREKQALRRHHSNPEPPNHTRQRPSNTKSPQPQSDLEQERVEALKKAAVDFPEFSAEEIASFVYEFIRVAGSKVAIDPNDLYTLLIGLKEKGVDKSELRRLVDSIDEDKSGTIEFPEFLLLMRKMRSGTAGMGLKNAYTHMLSNQVSWRHLFKRVKARPSVDFVLLQSSTRLLRYDAMADHKANVLITVCAIILSFSLTQVNKGQASYSLLTFSLFTMVALFFAAGAVIPRYHREASVSSSNAKVKNFDLLHFDDFCRIPMDSFMESMAEVLVSDDRLYSEMVKDIYLMGKNLSALKYVWIRRSYLSFGWGTLATVLVFVLSTIFKWDASTLLFNDTVGASASTTNTTTTAH